MSEQNSFNQPPMGEASTSLPPPEAIAMSPAQQLGLEDGKFDVVRNSGAVEKGWSVDGIGTKIVDGVEVQVVDISTPQFDDEGNRLYLEDGTPNDNTKYGLPLDKLMAMQKVDSVEIGEVSEAEHALEEIGSTAVSTEVEVEEESPVAVSTAAEAIQAQIDSKDDWVEHSVDLKTDTTETTEAVKAVEAVESIETSESMRQSFESITEQIGILSSEVGPFADKIASSPKEFAAQVEGFVSTLDRDFSGLGDSVRVIRNMLNGVDMGFMFDLRMNPNQPISSNDIQSIDNMHAVISRVTNELQDLNRRVEQAQQNGSHAQALLSENVGGQVHDIAVGVDDLVHAKVRKVKDSIDETGGELAKKAFAQTELSDSDSATNVTKGDERHVDKLSHIGGRLSVESSHLLDDAETADRMVSAKIGLNSQDFTRNILNYSELRPGTIGEVTAHLQAVASRLGMASQMRGSKGSLHAEIGFDIKQTIERAFDQISRFRQPTTENLDMQAEISSAQIHVKEMAATAQGFAGLAQSLARESEISR